MLNKKVCQKCWGDKWSALDEHVWNTGNAKIRVYCKLYYGQTPLSCGIDIQGSAPERCPYLLEQLMAEQNAK